jgi:hypothetical protein
VTSTVVIGGYCTLPECLMTITRRANSAKVLRSSTSAKLYSYETLRERLAQDLRHMAAALGPCIQEAHAVVGQRHFARQRYGAAAQSRDTVCKASEQATQAADLRSYSKVVR